MALVQAVQDGKLVDTSASASSSSTASSKASASSTSGLDKEAFLQLLVAQMRHHDPLQPACYIFTVRGNTELRRYCEQRYVE